MENQKGEILFYQREDGSAQIDVRLEEDTVWLTQAQLVILYQSSKVNVSEHIKHIFEEGELIENSVVRNFRTTAPDGKNYITKHYILDMFISVGYRIKKYCYSLSPMGNTTTERIHYKRLYDGR